MQKRAKVALGVFVTFYVAFGVFVAVQQEKIIYQPWVQDFEACAGFADADKVVYQGTRMYVKEGEQGVAVLYHGNAGAACDRAFYAEQFVAAGYGYVFPEYAGYSNDARETSHELVKQDVRNVVAYLEDMNAPRTVVVGESIGTGPASYHVSLVAPNSVLLIAPFASLADVAQRKFWFYPTRLLVDNAFDNIELLRTYAGPVTIMHGDTDMVIPQESGRKLYESLMSSDKSFVSIEGKGHNDLFTTPESFRVVQKVLGV